MTKQTEQGAALTPLRVALDELASALRRQEELRTQKYGDGLVERRAASRRAQQAWRNLDAMAAAPIPSTEGCGFAQVDLTDDEIDACVGNLGMAPYSVLAGPEEIRKFARKLLAAWAEAAAATSHPTPKE